MYLAALLVSLFKAFEIVFHDSKDSQDRKLSIFFVGNRCVSDILHMGSIEQLT